MATITGNPGNDNLSGTAGADIFRLKSGGDDTASGLAGDDTFYMGAAFTALDAIDGGADTDKVWLSGDYAAGVVFGATTLTNVEGLRLGGAFDYNLTTHDATVAAGARLTVNASPLAAGHKLTFDGSAETDGRFNIIATAGDDVLTGGAKGDVFRLTGGGIDSAYGGGGNDKFHMGDTFTANDTIDGGLGLDTVNFIGLGGDDDLIFTATTMIDVETLALAAGIVPTLVTHDATVAAGATLTVDGATAGGYQFDGSAEADGGFILVGSSSGNVLKGGAGADTFDLTLGGTDFAFGNGGNDAFVMGAAFDATDQLDGGANVDQVFLEGNYAGLIFGASTITNIEAIVVAAGFSYNLTINDGNLAVLGVLTVDGSALGASDTLTFSGLAETSAGSHFNLIGGAGNDVLTGGGAGAHADTFDLTHGGNDTAYGGTGDDTFTFGAAFTASDTVDGGAGSDDVALSGDYTGGNSIVLSATSLLNVNSITLASGHSYNLTTHDATVTAGGVLFVQGSALGAGETLTFNGSADTDGAFSVAGGAGDDTLIGSADGNNFLGRAGADQLTGGAALDTFSYLAASESTSSAMDVIHGLDLDEDNFDLSIAIASTGTESGDVDAATFDTDMGTIVNDGIPDATLVTVTGGDLIGKVYLVIDSDDSDFYSAGDQIIEITGYTGTIDTGDFI